LWLLNLIEMHSNKEATRISKYCLVNGELYHYGVKGMKWGVRKTSKSLGSKKIISNPPDKKSISVEKAIKKQSSSSLKKGIRSLSFRIYEHKSKIENPSKYCPEWGSYSEERKKRLLKHWKKEILDFQTSIDNRIKELKERGEFDGK
jgi:hypothetical protein